MIQVTDNKIKVQIISKDTIKISAGSFVIDNKWVSFSGTLFKISDYIKSTNRGKFFNDRNYAVYLLICLDIERGIVVEEGPQVLFTSVYTVPLPKVFNALPLVGIILIQNGTSDLTYGFKDLEEEYIFRFSSLGNIIDKNLVGKRGADSIDIGDTGLQGETGLKGERGITGKMGITGSTGCVLPAPQGETGLQGMTGINWDIYIPFDELI